MTGIVKGLLGRKSSAERVLERFRPQGFQSPGFSGALNRATDQFVLRRGPEATRALANITGATTTAVGGIRGLRSQVAPGFGRLSRERIDAIRTAGRRAVGNLREELSRRRVLGSSFAQREIAGVEASFGQQESLARAETFVQELDLTNRLIGQEFQTALQGLTTVLNQFNLEASLASGSAQMASQLLNANLTAQAEARASQEAGAAEFLGTVIGAFAPLGGGGN